MAVVVSKGECVAGDARGEALRGYGALRSANGRTRILPLDCDLKVVLVGYESTRTMPSVVATPR